MYKGVQDIKRSTSFIDFSSKIETAPHNKMHNYIGTGLSGPAPDPQTKFNKIFNGVFNGDTTATPEKGDGLMTDVESAGFDPIFWMHHGNIDRLWDQWTSLHKQYITSNDLDVDGQDDWKYTFFDPKIESDGAIGWAEVNYTLEDVIAKVYNLGYKYDDTPMVQPPSKRLLAEVSQPSAPPTQLASQEVGKAVGSNRPIDLQLPVKPQMITELRRLRSGNSIPTATKGFTLEVDVTYTGRPYSSYDVFLNLPDEESKRDIDTYFAGSISFFVIPSTEPVTKTFKFDITDELLLQLEKLGEKMHNENLSVSIRKVNGKKEESVKIEQVSLYAY
ncbi:tyrosinase family protein [Microcoleus sp. B4-C1]|uniref:tyrosinase family protein n=1 Tax=Microcoleus sp. B4-C1 TaxID=2818660 RepID=UPI002FD6B44A